MSDITVGRLMLVELLLTPTAGLQGADADVPSPAGRSGKLVADYKANQDGLRFARQAQRDFNKAVQRAGTAQEVVNLLRSSAADKDKQGLYPGLAEQVAAADAQAAAAATKEGEEVSRRRRCLLDVQLTRFCQPSVLWPVVFRSSLAEPDPH